jgi:hypothetical protein
MSAAAFAARRKRQPMPDTEAARQLARATLGVRYSEIAAATGQRFDQYVDAQLALPVTPGQCFTSLTNSRLPGFPAGPVIEGLGWPGWNQFFNWKFQQPEKLRTRIAYAMFEYFSVGGLVDALATGRAQAVLWDILEEEAVGGTFRSMIERISRSQVMSRWLTYYKNARSNGVTQPDENYARELMQLYTIGLYMLRPDGTRMPAGELPTDDPRYVAGSTADVPTYVQSDIFQVARVFTGMTTTETYDNTTVVTNYNDTFQYGPGLGTAGLLGLNGERGWAVPLVFAPGFHETGTKIALQGRVNIPANTPGDQSLDMLLDALVAHPSCAPFFATNMIRLLTTSNPRPEYVARVVSAFRTSPQGNLPAMFRAIFLDQDVLAPQSKALTVRVPAFEESRLRLLLSTAPRLTAEGAPMGEGLGAFPGLQTVEFYAYGMEYVSPLQHGQNPSVFGRWPKAYRAAGAVFDGGLVSPELATLGESNVSLLYNSGQLFERVGNLADPTDRANVRTTGNRTALLARLNLVLCAGTAPPALMTQLSDWLATRGADQDTEAGVSETYRSLCAVLWLSPYSIART